MKEIICYSFFIVIFFTLAATNVRAASFSFSPLSTQSFSYNEEISIKAKLTITTPDETIYYLRGVFYKEGSSNYCGLTWNGTTYYKGPYTTNEGWKNFLKISIKENTWESDLKVKLDTEDSGCKESGNYLFKVERFTESGSGSFDSQDALAVTFSIPSPTPSPEPTIKPSPTPHLASTPRPTSPIKITTVTPSQNVSSTTALPSQSSENTTPNKPNPHFIGYESSDEAVLGDATESAFITPNVSLTPTQFPVKVLGSSSSLWPFIFSAIGVVTIIFCAILGFLMYKRGK